jgi:hypothetical protein
MQPRTEYLMVQLKLSTSILYFRAFQKLETVGDGTKRYDFKHHPAGRQFWIIIGVVIVFDNDQAGKFSLDTQNRARDCAAPHVQTAALEGRCSSPRWLRGGSFEHRRKRYALAEQINRSNFNYLSGAANRTRTCDPVITNDVLYQLSYCGEPFGAFGKLPKTPAPDIGQGPDWQGKRWR